MKIYYDLSRLLDRFDIPRASGIDRVDLHYALWSRDWASEWFGVLQHPNGLSILNPEKSDQLLASLKERWLEVSAEGGDQYRTDRSASTARPRGWRLEAQSSILEKVMHVGLKDRLEGRSILEWPYYLSPTLSQWLLSLGHRTTSQEANFAPGAYYWNIGHNYRFAAAAAKISAIFERRSVFFVHDVIPLLYPETQRRASRLHFQRFCHWIKQINGRLIVSSQSTVNDIEQVQGASPALFDGLLSQHIQLPLPTEFSSNSQLSGSQNGGPKPPYFIMLGRWEPRKNFELLLKVWELLANSHTERIILKWVGDRGVIPRDSKARLVHLRAMGWFEELGAVSDAEIKEQFSGARALLFPSLAEGWGLPVAEALSCGLPVIASDLPICREVSQGLAEYRSPQNIEDWRAAVLDFAVGDSQLRSGQVRRIGEYRGLLWEYYFDQLSNQIKAQKGIAAEVDGGCKN